MESFLQKISPYRVYAPRLYTAYQQGYEKTGTRYNEAAFLRDSRISKYVSGVFEVQDCNFESAIHVIPDGCNDILFAFDGNKVCSFLSPTIVAPYRFYFGKMQWIFGVRFFPGATYAILRDSLESSLSQAIPLNSQLRGFHAVEDVLCRTDTFEKRCEIIMSYLDTIVAEPDGVENILFHCMKRIISAQGIISIKDMAVETGYTERYIRELFSRYVGHSPKSLSNIIRMQNALQYMSKSQNPSLSEAAFLFGFSDQSHLNREFKKFLHVTSGSVREDANWLSHLQPEHMRTFIQK